MLVKKYAVVLKMAAIFVNFPLFHFIQQLPFWKWTENILIMMLIGQRAGQGTGSKLPCYFLTVSTLSNGRLFQISMILFFGSNQPAGLLQHKHQTD